MDRLTTRIPGGVEVDRKAPVAIMFRLAEYEDTGLSPEAIREMYQHYKFGGPLDIPITRERFEEISKAEKEGRLLVLPCKVGTAVYRLDFNQHDGAWLEPHFFRLQDLEAIGTSIFLTREEAEAEIRRLEHG